MPSCEDDAHKSADSGRPLSSSAFDKPSARRRKHGPVFGTSARMTTGGQAVELGGGTRPDRFASRSSGNLAVREG